jgi:hypothetical protein
MRLCVAASIIVSFLFAAAAPAWADIYATTYGDSSLRRFNETTGAQIGSPVTTAGLASATGLSVKGTNLYVSSLNTGTVFKFDTTTSAFSTYGSAPGGLGSSTFGPAATADAGNLFVGNLGAGNVFVFDGVLPGPAKTFTAVVPAAVPSAAIGGLAFGPNNDLFVGDIGPAFAGNPGAIYRVQNPTSLTPTVTTFASGGGLLGPAGLYWHGNTLYASDIASGVIWLYGQAGGTPSSAIPLPQYFPNPDPGGDPGYSFGSSPASIIPDRAGTGFFVALGGPSQVHPTGSIGHYLWDGTPISGGAFASINQVVTGVAIVPEPSSYALASIAALGFLAFVGRSKLRYSRAA